MIVATAFVMLMTPTGLALFYGGMTGKKNVLNTMGMSLIAFAVAIASGSIIERVKFSTFTIFSALWILLVYAPITHLAWGGGESLNFGEMDFAGGSVVHINAGVAGFVVAMILGKRRDYGKAAIKPFSPVLTVVGAALLWFGWFGFNAGSEVAADGIAANAFLVTNVAASLGVIGWLIIEYLVYKKATLVGGASGAVAGLVAITPASGSADVMGAIIIGLVGGALGFIGVAKIKKLFKVDDSLDAFWVHGLVGIWGSIATALFIAPYLIPENFNLGTQLMAQLKAIGLTIVYSGIMTAVVYFISALLTGGRRVDKETELKGLDTEIHGEEAINL